MLKTNIKGLESRISGKACVMPYCWNTAELQRTKDDMDINPRRHETNSVSIIQGNATGCNNNGKQSDEQSAWELKAASSSRLMPATRVSSVRPFPACTLILTHWTNMTNPKHCFSVKVKEKFKYKLLRTTKQMKCSSILLWAKYPSIHLLNHQDPM